MESVWMADWIDVFIGLRFSLWPGWVLATLIYYRQLLKIPRSKKCYYEIKELLRALRFFLESFYFFFNRIARYAQSKESRNLLKKIS